MFGGVVPQVGGCWGCYGGVEISLTGAKLSINARKSRGGRNRRITVARRGNLDVCQITAVSRKLAEDLSADTGWGVDTETADGREGTTE